MKRLGADRGVAVIGPVNFSPELAGFRRTKR
jgi:hypothetical protein